MTNAPASRTFTCEECGSRFLPADGGTCRRCGRALCMRHFPVRDWGILALIFRRRERAGDEGPICRKCVKETAASD